MSKDTPPPAHPTHRIVLLGTMAVYALEDENHKNLGAIELDQLNLHQFKDYDDRPLAVLLDTADPDEADRILLKAAFAHEDYEVTDGPPYVPFTKTPRKRDEETVAAKHKPVDLCELLKASLAGEGPTT